MKLDNLILEALKPSQFRPYMKPDARPNKIIQDELDAKFKAFNGQKNRSGDRIYLPFEVPQNIDTRQFEIMLIIENALSEIGYTLSPWNSMGSWDHKRENYLKGICRKKIGDDKREFKIGKILSKLEKSKKYEQNLSSLIYSNPQMFNKFKDIKSILRIYNEDPDRAVSNSNKYLICISKHPYDIAGMSTDRGWTSCMNLVGGVYRQKVGVLIEAGGLVAYLIKDDDLNIEHPLGRVSIYTLNSIEDEDDVAWAEGRVCYGSILSQNSIKENFLNIISEWIKENLLKDKDGFYKRNTDQYNEISKGTLKLGDKGKNYNGIIVDGIFLSEDTYGFYHNEDMKESYENMYDQIVGEIEAINTKVCDDDILCIKNKIRRIVWDNIDYSDLESDYYWDRFSDMWDAEDWMRDNLDYLIGRDYSDEQECFDRLGDLLDEDEIKEYADEEGNMKDDLDLKDLQAKLLDFYENDVSMAMGEFDSDLDNARDEFMSVCMSNVSYRIEVEFRIEDKEYSVYC